MPRELQNSLEKSEGKRGFLSEIRLRASHDEQNSVEHDLSILMSSHTGGGGS